MFLVIPPKDGFPNNNVKLAIKHTLLNIKTSTQNCEKINNRGDHCLRQNAQPKNWESMNQYDKGLLHCNQSKPTFSF
jgi:hypothetical protein